MAEAVARDLLESGQVPGHGREVFVASAGLGAWDGSPFSEETLAALRKRGISPDGHSKRLTPEMVRKAALVLGMTRSHVVAARALVGGEEHQRKVHLLDPAGDLDDPIGMGQEAYDDLAHHFAELIPSRISAMLPS
jgi:protein-tyrosine phosphatase